MCCGTACRSPGWLSSELLSRNQPVSTGLRPAALPYELDAAVRRRHGPAAQLTGRSVTAATPAFSVDDAAVVVAQGGGVAGVVPVVGAAGLVDVTAVVVAGRDGGQCDGGGERRDSCRKGLPPVPSSWVVGILPRSASWMH